MTHLTDRNRPGRPACGETRGETTDDPRKVTCYFCTTMTAYRDAVQGATADPKVVEVLVAETEEVTVHLVDGIVRIYPDWKAFMRLHDFTDRLSVSVNDWD